MMERWKQSGKKIVEKSPEEWAAEAGTEGACPRCGSALRVRVGIRCEHSWHRHQRVAPIKPTYHAGDKCPNGNCEGRLRTRTTDADTDGDGIRTRRFECKFCGEKCSCEVDADSVSARNHL